MLFASHVDSFLNGRSKSHDVSVSCDNGRPDLSSCHSSSTDESALRRTLVDVKRSLRAAAVSPHRRAITARLLPSIATRWQDRLLEGNKMAERSQTPAEDPFGGRTPTSHERMAGRPWDSSYQDGPAPWDFGGPQPAIVRVAAEGGFTGAVLDAGCGSGENALYIASLGLPVLGVDVAETALALARERAAERGIEAEFVVADALHLERLGRRFQTLLDCGLFHTFDNEERLEYVASLAAVTEHDGTLCLLCFSDEDSDVPHPVSQQDLKAAFTPSAGWTITTIAHDRVRTRFHDTSGAPAWLATINRL